MRRTRRLKFAGLLLLALALPARAEEPARPEEEVQLRDIDAVVREILVSRLEGGEEWVDAIVEPEAGGPVRIRLAPPKVMSRSGFSLSAGDHARIRYFTGESPFPVQRIRNQDTGRILRLRCMHGEPLWPWAGEHGGPGRHGPHREGRGGPGRGPGGRSGSPP